MNWRDRAFDMLKDFLQSSSSASTGFMAEDVRLFGEGRGLPPAADSRSWGGVMRRAQGAGLIVHTGYLPSNNPEAHRRPTAVWAAA